MSIHHFIRKVWVDRKEIAAAKVVIRATAELKRFDSYTAMPFHNGSECSLTVKTSDAYELYVKAAELQRVQVAILKDNTVCIASGLLIIGQEESTDEEFTVFEMRYGYPPQLRTEKQWMESLR